MSGLLEMRQTRKSSSRLLRCDRLCEFLQFDDFFRYILCACVVLRQTFVDEAVSLAESLPERRLFWWAWLAVQG